MNETYPIIPIPQLVALPEAISEMGEPRGGSYIHYGNPVVLGRANRESSVLAKKVLRGMVMDGVKEVASSFIADREDRDLWITAHSSDTRLLLNSRGNGVHSIPEGPEGVVQPSLIGDVVCLEHGCELTPVVIQYAFAPPADEPGMVRSLVSPDQLSRTSGYFGGERFGSVVVYTQEASLYDASNGRVHESIAAYQAQGGIMVQIPQPTVESVIERASHIVHTKKQGFFDVIKSYTF